MAKTLSILNVGLTGTFAGLAGSLKGAIGELKSFGSTVAGIGTSLISFTGVAGAIAGVVAGFAGIGEGFKLAEEFEKATVQLNALTGSTQVAGALLGQLKEFAASSPFEFPELLQASKRLLAVGVGAANISPLLHDIGEVAAGSGNSVESLAEIFSKVAAEGTVSSKTLKQFSKDGIPLVAELAKRFGVTQDAVKDMADAGRLGFGDLRAAFASLSGPGGKFTGILEAQAGTLGGVFHTVKTEIGYSLASIAETINSSFDFKGVLSNVLGGLSGVTATIQSGIATAAPYVTKFATTVKTVLGDIWSYIAPGLARAYTGVAAAWPAIVAVTQAAGSSIWGTIRETWGQISGFIGPILADIGANISANWQSYVETVTTLAVSIYDAVSSTFTAVVGVVEGIWEGLSSVWNAGVNMIMGTSEQAGTSVSGSFTGIGSIVKWMADTVSGALQIAAYAIRSWKEEIEIVGLAASLFAVRIGNEIEYTFGTQIPTVIKWFADNWKDILTDVFNLSNTIFENLATNIWHVFTSLPDLISGSVDWSQVWTPLTTGFEAHLKTLPQIAARQQGALEKSLSDQLGDLGGKYFDGLLDHMNANDRKAKDAAGKITKGISDAMKPVIPQVAAPQIPKPDPLKIDASLNKDTFNVEIQPEIKEAKLIKSGTAEAGLARYLRPTLGNTGKAPEGPKPAKVGEGPLTGPQEAGAAAPTPPDTEDWHDAALDALKGASGFGGLPPLAIPKVSGSFNDLLTGLTPPEPGDIPNNTDNSTLFGNPFEGISEAADLGGLQTANPVSPQPISNGVERILQDSYAELQRHTTYLKTISDAAQDNSSTQLITATF